MFWRQLLSLCCCLLLAAHFWRADAAPMVVLSLLMAVVGFVPRVWAARLVQVYLYFGVGVWGWVGWRLVALRLETGRPFLRLVAILATVAALTAWTAFRLRQRVGTRTPD